MTRFLKSNGFRIFVLVMVCLIAGSVFATLSRNSASPLTSITSVVFAPQEKIAGIVSSAFGKLPISFRSSSVLKNENDELQAEIDSLREQLVDYEQVVHENEMYKEFFQLKEDNSDYSFEQAAVVGRDSADMLGSLVLNKGSSSGVEINDPVISGKYLIGVVVSITPTQCTVNTILNPEVNVSAYEIRTRELGYVTTTAELSEKGQCCIPGLSPGTTVAVGGTVCTSGVGGIYPRDLIIGKIVEIVDSTVDISASAIISPGVDISQVTDVFIITDFEK